MDIKKNSYGYNNAFYVLGATDNQFQKALIFTAIAIFIELIVYFSINHCILTKIKQNHMFGWSQLVRSQKIYLFFVIFGLTHIATDACIGKISIQL